MTLNPVEARDRLISDFRTLALQAEDLVKATAGMSGESLTAARTRLVEGLRTLTRDIADSPMVERGRHAALAADRYVHDRPYPFIAGALLAGLVIGMAALASRR